MEEPVTLIDREVLKVLSTDTRMDILKELSEGGRTPSFLGKRLKKSDATIVEHLEVLCKAGLVKKVEQPGKKWIFYTLTERGQGIISSKTRRLVIILGSSAVAFLGGAMSLSQYLNESQFFAINTRAAAEAGKLMAPTAAATPSISVALYLSVALFAISIIGFSFYFFQKSKLKRVEV